MIDRDIQLANMQETQKNCLICHDSIKNLDKYQNNHLSKCSNCGFVFSHKIPTQEELGRYYQNDYDRTRYFSPITKKRYNELLDQLEEYRSSNRILDLGCGYGSFLEVAKSRGWEVYGVELAKEAVEVCEGKGINMYHGEISDCDFEAETFDVVVSIEVIEHLIDPNTLIDTGKHLLKKGGLFYITTPNFNSYLRYQLRENYDVIDYPNHLAYFTKKTLNTIFTKHQFKKVKIQTTGISLTRLRTSKKMSNQDFVSETSDDEMFRYRIEKNKGLKILKSIANKSLDLFNLGVTLKGSFIKS